MSDIHSSVNCQQLWHKIFLTIKDWTVDGTAVLMGNGASAGIPPILGELCKEAIKEIEGKTGMKALHIMVNRLPAGVHVPVHIDPVKGDPFRWHLPLKTSFHCYHWDTASGVRHLSAGRWHNINYTIPHAIGNFGTEERVHLIVDLINER